MEINYITEDLFQYLKSYMGYLLPIRLTSCGINFSSLDFKILSMPFGKC